MRFSETIVALLAGTSVASSLSIRTTHDTVDSISRRDPEPDPEVLETIWSAQSDEESITYLEKRRGGGGSGGGGGGRGSSGSSGSSSSGSSSGSSGSGSTSGGAAGAAGGGSRNTGTAGSSSSIGPSYGGGRYYGGGATSSYRAGGRSPGAGILPFALAGGALGIFPGLWLAGAYAYPYNHPYSFHNHTNSSEPTNQNETLPVTCLCQMYNACGCDDNNNSTYLDSLLGNGSVAAQNSSLVHVGLVNGTKTVVLNGTLPNGTDTSAAAASSTGTSSAAMRQSVLETSGFWMVGTIVGATVWLL